MEENKDNEIKENEVKENSSNKSKLFIGGVIALAILAIPGFLVARKLKRALFNKVNTTVASTVSSESNNSDVKQDQINVHGGSFYFKPNELKVKKGEKVSILFTNDEGVHNFVIDELNVKSQTIKGGATTTVEFTPDKTGTFEFYCSIGNHRAMGMKGTLIVE